MINKRLLSYMKDSKKYIYYHVLCQWIALLSQIVIIYKVAIMIDMLFNKETIDDSVLFTNACILFICMIVKYVMQKIQSKVAYQASSQVKHLLRQQIYEKLLKLNRHYTKYVATSEIVQLSVEGVDQLETYFGRYLPQFFYSLLAPITLFLLLMRIDFQASLVLLICVPLIPISIVVVQKIAKRLLSQYWGLYGSLGDRFLDNIRGLTTLKIYGSDEKKHQEMNEEAERFRKITMKVLIMQLNSISIMDLVAFGGAAIGILISLSHYYSGQITIGQTFMMVMLSAEFFIPLRLLGSYFHIAMNGNAASQKIFKFLDEPIPVYETTPLVNHQPSILFENVDFSYDGQKQVLHEINFKLMETGMYSIVGKSGSGKSTLAALMKGDYLDYQGKIQIFNQELKTIDHRELMQNMTLIEHAPYLFKGTVRSQLLDACPDASDEMMLECLKKVNLYDFIMENQGLDTPILERGSNLSGGQAQRLNLARALLHDTPIYIFDEATSNIDVESENAILDVIKELAKTKLVLMISHRLANVVEAKETYVLEEGKIIASGKHHDLMQYCDVYRTMVNVQNDIEKYVGGGINE